MKKSNSCKPWGCTHTNTCNLINKKIIDKKIVNKGLCK